jgi:hypothetical protein
MARKRGEVSASGLTDLGGDLIRAIESEISKA